MDESKVSLVLIDKTAMSVSLSTLPKEIRHHIWRALQDDLDAERLDVWHKNPTFAFASLSLTCRQFYKEIREYRPQHVVPFSRFLSLCHQLSYDSQSAVRLQKYRSVTIQFRHDAGRRHFALLALVMETLVNLEELRLSFIGPDGHGNSTYLHGCGYVEDGDKEAKLTPDAQRADIMIPVMREIGKMTKLRVLVLSNLNLQLFMTFLAQNKKLEYLHITADPRSAVHTYFVARHRFSAIAVPSFTIPLKVLNLCANGMLNAPVLLTKCSSTIEHFTWTIPDACLGWNVPNTPLFSLTQSLLSHLALNAPNLHTLRICIAGRGNHDRNYHHEVASLRNGLTMAIGSMRGLRNLEIHFGEQKLVPRYWAIGTEVLAFLPPGLKRFYTNDRLVLPRELHKVITEKYLSRSTVPRPPLRPDELRRVFWSPKPPYPEPENDPFPEYRTNIPEDEQIRMWLHPTSYTKRFFNDNDEFIGTEIIRSQAHRDPYFLHDEGIIGEDFDRKDYIPLRDGCLKFVSYQFQNPEYDCKTTSVGESQTQMVLRLNGRLLDRERNRHLAFWSPLQHIPSILLREEQQDREGPFFSENMHYRIMLYNLLEPEHSDPRKHREAKIELAMSPLTDDPSYFGTEDEAQQIFSCERVAKPEDREPAVYPYFHDVDLDDQCHWMCPEADVPTLAEIIKNEKQKAREQKIESG